MRELIVEQGTETRASRIRARLSGTMDFLFSPVDIASLAVFRMGFGLMMAWWAFDYLVKGRVTNLFVTPRFHFSYYGFGWVQPWPGAGMHLEFAVILFCALCVSFGLFYRAASLVVALGFTHFFLIDRTNYQNHYYLLMLVSWLLVLLPLHRQWSLDVLNGLTPRATTVPAWMLWLLRFQIALPYVFGGVAKLDADWFAGEPMRQVLGMHDLVPYIGPWLKTEFAVQFFIWGGLLFDLLVVPLLLWRRTRILAYLVCLGFHVTNAYLFNIHVFPWFMIFATTLFFAPDWPRRILRTQQPAVSTIFPRRRWIVAGLAVYCGFHLLWPFRHLAYGQDEGWTERGHYFAWRMMLRGKTTGLRYYMTDPQTGQTWTPDIRQFINEEQSGKFARDPEMILHLAHFLAGTYREQAGKDVEVRALVLTSLNGRKPELLIDPVVDLAGQPRGFHRRSWIMPQTEPLRKEPWRVPLIEWERHVKLPPLPFLQRTNTAEVRAVVQSEPTQ